MPDRPVSPRTARWWLRAIAASLVFSSLAVAGEDTRAWLERMSHSAEQLNYRGILVHFQGGESAQMSIAHRVDGTHITERITSADARREIIRTDNEVTCILPDQRLVLVEKRDGLDKSKNPLQGHLSGSARVEAALYHLSDIGTERIAGRAARGIAIRPRDGYRYGYRIWLDRESAMPLQIQLVDERGVVLEHARFTVIELPPQIAASEVKPTIATDGFTVRRSGAATAQAYSEARQGWAATDLPPGFRLKMSQVRTVESGGRGLHHMVYSDGLATVSLFVEPAVAASEQAEGLSQMGAAYAYTTIVDGYMVTAIGEVPMRTVETLARSARPAAKGLEAAR